MTLEIHVVVGLNTPEADAAALDACDRECGKSGKMNAMPGPLRIRGSVVIPEVELRAGASRARLDLAVSRSTPPTEVEIGVCHAGHANPTFRQERVHHSRVRSPNVRPRPAGPVGQPAAACSRPRLLCGPAHICREQSGHQLGASLTFAGGVRSM